MLLPSAIFSAAFKRTLIRSYSCPARLFDDFVRQWYLYDLVIARTYGSDPYYGFFCYPSNFILRKYSPEGWAFIKNAGEIDGLTEVRTALQVFDVFLSPYRNVPLDIDASPKTTLHRYVDR